MISGVGIIQIDDGMVTEKDDYVAAEHTLRIEIDGQFHTELACTPQNLAELKAGYLLSMGELNDKAVVKPVPDGPNINLTDILAGMNQLVTKSEAFLSTGAVHSCALIIGGELTCFMEDISRHSAFDKTIGAALMSNIPLSNAVVLTTGRIPSDMLIKIINSGIAIAVSRSAPTDKAVELARQFNMTLCGFARGNRINIYAGSERIII